MKRAQRQGSAVAGVVRVDGASPASSFRELDDAFLQKQTKIWLGEVLHLRFDEDILVADLLADGELLFQLSKVIWKRLLKKNKEQLKQSKVYIYEKTSFGKSNGKYMPYPKVDSFLKICQILGLAGIDLFTPSDVVEKRNARKVCMCIRSLSKKARMMRLNVPDFDIVTYTITMPNYIVGGIRRSLEQPQCSSSGSSGPSGYSPRANSKALHQQRIFGGQNDHQGDTHYDSDEAESRLSVLEPEDTVDEDNLSVHLQLSNARKEEREGYGDSGHNMHEEKSLAESVGSLDFGVMDSDSVDSTPLIHNKESCCFTQSPTDQCSRTRTTKCSLSSEESDSISSHLGLDDTVKNDLDAPPVEVSKGIYDGQANRKRFAVHPNKGSDDLQKYTGTTDQQCDVLVCDRESVCSSCEEPRFGLSAEPSDLSSESYSGLNPRHPTGDKLPAVSEDDSTYGGLKPEFSSRNQTDASKSESKPVKSEDTVKNNSTTKRPGNDIPKSGKGVVKSVAVGITLVGAVIFIVHLRRSKERSFTSVIPSISEKSIQGDSRANSVDKGKAAAVYPGEWLKV